MKLRFTPQATQDLVAIADFLRERDPQAAARVRAALLESLQNLSEFPRLGGLATLAAKGSAGAPVTRNEQGVSA